MANVTEAGIIVPTDDDAITPYNFEGQFQKLQRQLIEGAAAIEELEVAKAILAFAIDKLPKKQLKITLSEQARLSELVLQQKQENSGAILFRAVKA